MKNIKVSRIEILPILFAFFLIGCSPIYKITDNYVVHSEDEKSQGYYLTCNPGCDYDVFIGNVKSIYWDKRHIIVEQMEKTETKWYIVIARGDELACCNRDTTVGPISESKLLLFVKNNHLDLHDMRKKEW